MTVAHTLAAFACDTTRITSAARSAAVRAVFDLFAAAIAGRKTGGGIAALKAAPVAWGRGPGRRAGSRTCVSPFPARRS